MHQSPLFKAEPVKKTAKGQPMNWFRVDTRQPDRTRSSGLYPDTRILTLAFGTLNDTEGSSPKTKRGDRWPAVRLHITPESPESGREPHYRGNVRIGDI